jgi:hypothetical protein
MREHWCVISLESGNCMSTDTGLCHYPAGVSDEMLETLRLMEKERVPLNAEETKESN